MGFFDIFKKKKKMSDGLEKTRTDFFQNIVNTLTSSVIDDDLYNDLEEQLILADVGPSCAVRLVDELRDEVEINGLHTGQEALDALRDIIRREVSPTPAGASRTQCRPEKLQKGVADKGVRPLHRQ